MDILLTKITLSENMEFLDDLLTFEELGKHLKSQGCHVANLSSSDFSSKTGIGGCLKSLLRQFLKVTVDVSSLIIEDSNLICWWFLGSSFVVLSRHLNYPSLHLGTKKRRTMINLWS